MSISAEFTKNIFSILRTHLASLGFKERKPGIMTYQMPDGVIGWIGLNKATRGQKELLEINPVVGVRNQQIEKLVSELLDEHFDEVVPATLAGNIGYLMPAAKYRPFIFSQHAPIEPIASELAQDIREYGLPFIRKHVELGVLVESLRTCRFAVRFMADYRIPCGLLLLGRIDEAEAYLQEKTRAMNTQHDPAAVRYKAFASKFLQRAAEIRKKS